MKTKVTNPKMDYVLVALLIIFSSNANSIVKMRLPVAIFIFVAILIFLQRRRRLENVELTIFVVFFLFILSYAVKYGGEVDPAFTFRVFSYIALSYLVLKNVGYGFFYIYEKLMYFFALLSLPLFFIQLLNYDFLYRLLRSLQSLVGLPLYNMEYANVVFFTLNKGQMRNCGFAWEPGGFGQFLVLAIIINLARRNFSISNNSTLWVLLAALITTFSTSAYLALLPIAFWVLSNVPFKKKLLLIPALLIAFAYISTLPFMTEKILRLSSNPVQTFTSTVRLANWTGSSYSLGRFAGLYMSITDFTNNPVIGYGGHGEITFRGTESILVASINGLGRWLAMFGSVGFIIFLYSYWQSCANLLRLYQVKYPAFAFASVLILGFSFNVIQSGLFFAFMVSFLIVPYDKYNAVQ